MIATTFVRTYGPYRSPDGCRTYVTVELRDLGDGRQEASFQGEEFRKHSRHPFAGGQHKGSAPEALKTLWDRWHLNSMKAGCEHQEARYRVNPDERPTWMNGYTGSTGDTLSPHDGSACRECGYAYGSEWKYEPLPDDLLDQIDAAAKDRVGSQS